MPERETVTLWRCPDYHVKDVAALFEVGGGICLTCGKALVQRTYAETSPGEVVVQGYVHIDEEHPPLKTPVLFFCQVDDVLTQPEVGEWTGERTQGNAIVMDVGDYPDDWSPCTHWMPLPAGPEVKG